MSVLLAMTDLIRISTTDPLWITVTLITLRTIALMVVLSWAITMSRQVRAWEWPWTWEWCFTSWIFAVMFQLIVSITRVLVVGHIRELDRIGELYRSVEIASAVSLAFWSIVAFWRWAHPLQSVSAEGVFATLATSMPMIVSDDRGEIVFVTDAFNDLAGYQGDELIGENLITIIPERLRDAHQAGLRRYLASGESHIIGQVVSLDLLRKDGAETPVYLALATATVDGAPWFCGSAWRQTGAIERQQSARSERQDAREDALDVRSDRADQRGRRQDAWDERLLDDATSLAITVAEIVTNTADDVKVVQADVKEVKKHVLDDHGPRT